MENWTQSTFEDRKAWMVGPKRGFAVMYQRWESLLFLHWAFEPHQIAETLPKGLRVDTFDGKAWVGVVPFLMRSVRPRFLPSMGSISNFLELNVRTYVVDEAGRPGVWFYSLDANQRLAVKVARRFFYLPYQDAHMQTQVIAGRRVYECQRQGEAAKARFDYAPKGTLQGPNPNSLEDFLVNRYLLFAYDALRDRMFMGQVHHAPYQVQGVELAAWSALPLEWDGFLLPSRHPDHVCMAADVAVDIFPIQRIA